MSSGDSSSKARLSQTITAGIALLCAAVGLIYFVNMTYDDAFISFRYAENLAHGRGLVFNVGERVEGYSNFLWTLMMALPARLGADHFEFGMLLAAKVLGALLTLATLGLLLRTALLVDPVQKGPQTTLVAGLYLGLSTPFIVWGDGALETPLLAFLLLATVHFALRENAALQSTGASTSWSMLLLLLAALTRPEPALLLVPLLAVHTFVRRQSSPLAGSWKPAVRHAWTFVLPYALYTGWRFQYYGELLPNTYFAKVHRDPLTLIRGWHYLENANDSLAWTPLAIAILTPVILTRRLSQRFVLVALLVVTSVSSVVVEGGDWMPAYRMFAPIIPLIALLVHAAWRAAASFELEHFNPPNVPNWVAPRSWLDAWRRQVTALAHNARSRVYRHALRVTLQLALVGAIAISSVSGFQSVQVDGFIPGFRGLHLDCFQHFEIARWMRREIHDSGLLAIGEAGVVPYYTGLPVLDLFGLLDKRIARMPGARHHKFDTQYVLSRRPEYVLLLARRDAAGRVYSRYTHGQQLLADSRFVRDYRIMHDFGRAILFRRIAGP
jgi:arabinofuranosyltransferase